MVEQGLTVQLPLNTLSLNLKLVISIRQWSSKALHAAFPAEAVPPEPDIEAELSAMANGLEAAEAHPASSTLDETTVTQQPDSSSQLSDLT